MTERGLNKKFEFLFEKIWRDELKYLTLHPSKRKPNAN